MMEEKIEQKIRNYLEAEVRQVEPPRDILAGVMLRLGDQDSLRQGFRIVPRNRWLLRSLVAIPAIAIIIILQILHPWAAPVPGFEDVMAKAYAAVEGLHSYRTELTLTRPNPSGDKITTVELNYVAPDRYYTRKTQNGIVDETIRIGNMVYYRTFKDGAPPLIFLPDSSGLAPDMGKTFTLLNSLHDLESLGVEKIDGVDTYHYRGNLYVTASRRYKVEVWIGKEDSLPRKQVQDGSVVRFFDFDQTIKIEAPMTSTGELQEGWHTLKSGPHLNINITSSIGGLDLAHSLIKYDISLSNDGLEDAKDVKVTLQTPATNVADKPDKLEAIPTNSGVPVDISSGRSVNFHVEWEFDGGTMSKMELAELVEQASVAVSYHTPDGTMITQSYPEK